MTVNGFEEIGTVPQLVQAAAYAIESAIETHYAHEIRIDPGAGIYNCDCSGFVAFLLGEVAGPQLQQIESRLSGSRPLAHNFYEFFAALAPDAEPGWCRVYRLSDVKPGDLMAWKLADSRTGDTGHVFVVAAPPVTVPSDGSQSVRVHDSTAILHFDDTRGPPKAAADGIGSGSIHFRIDGVGQPEAFRFDPDAMFETVPIAIARLGEKATF